jgi:hypothetical protein
VNETEKIIHAYLGGSSGRVLRVGWPDFLAVGPDGRPFAVEVKDYPDRLSDAQIEAHKVLESAGLPVVTVYFYKGRVVDTSRVGIPQGVTDLNLKAAVNAVCFKSTEVDGG